MMSSTEFVQNFCSAEDLSLFSSIEQNDPALNSSEIEKKLAENEREAEEKTQQV